MIKELKPLVANLQKLEYGYYLMSEDYDIILLENDLDELWSTSLHIANEGKDTFYVGSTTVFEDAFLLCIEELWTKNETLFYKFVKTTVEGLIIKNENKDFSGLFMRLNDIGIPSIELSELQERAKTTTLNHRSKTTERKNKIFISHSSKDKFFGEKLVNFLKEIGVKNYEIIFTSNPAYGIPPGRNIFDWLKSQITEKPFVIYLLSENYYKSVACLNEMGAAWIVENQQVAIFTPKFDLNSKEFQSGALDPRKIGFYINDEDRLHTFIELLSIEFEINKRPLLLSQSVKNLIQEVNGIGGNTSVVTLPTETKNINTIKAEPTAMELKAAPAVSSHHSITKDTKLYSKFLQTMEGNKVKDDELILLHYITETGTYKLGTGWQESHEIENIREWETINEIKDLLSKNYSSVLKRYDLRGFTEVSATTSHGNPKEVKIKDEISNNLFDLPQTVLDAIQNAVKRNHHQYEEEENEPHDDVPF